jgi:hypothetical protein
MSCLPYLDRAFPELDAFASEEGVKREAALGVAEDTTASSTGTRSRRWR